MAGEQHPLPLWVLGADTTVVVDGLVLGKPADAGDAARMLRLLSGRSHQVTTGVCLAGLPPPKNPVPAAEPRSAQRDRFFDVRSETTTVTFSALSEDEIRAYIATGEPMDKAGAYAIQGVASRWISRLEGCYFNVVGLPVALVYCMLREHGAV
jgi:septum formation protein